MNLDGGRVKYLRTRSQADGGALCGLVSPGQGITGAASPIRRGPTLGGRFAHKK